MTSDELLNYLDRWKESIIKHKAEAVKEGRDFAVAYYKGQQFILADLLPIVKEMANDK